MRFAISTVLAAAFLALVFANAGVASDPTQPARVAEGQFTMTVVCTSSDRPIDGVQVTVRDVNTNIVGGGVTQAGRITVNNLPAGTYQISADNGRVIKNQAETISDKHLFVYVSF